MAEQRDDAAAERAHVSGRRADVDTDERHPRQMSDADIWRRVEWRRGEIESHAEQAANATYHANQALEAYRRSSSKRRRPSPAPLVGIAITGGVISLLAIAAIALGGTTGTNYSLSGLLWTMLWFFLFFMWFMLVVSIFTDVFRSRDLSGVSKTIWTMFIVFVPFLGVFIYLIARGDKMAQNHVDAAKDQQAAINEYIRSAAGASRNADELKKLASLRDAGTLSDEEYARFSDVVVQRSD